MHKVFTGATVVCPGTGTNKVKDVFVKDGRFADIDDPAAKNAERVACDGLILAPSLVDLNANLCDPGYPEREDLASGGRAAIAGGYGTVLVSPDTRPVADDPALVRDILDRAPDATEVEILVAGAITKGLHGKELAEVGLLRQAGAAALSNAGAQFKDTSALRFALLYAAPHGVPVLLRTGDFWLESHGAMHEGDVSIAIGLRGLPAAAEEIGTARYIALLRQTPATKLHITGVTSHRSVELIRSAKNDGLGLTASTPAHNLLLSDEAVQESVYDPNCRLMPPLRSEEDRLSLVEGIRTGVIDAVTSDHQPLTRADKELEFELAVPGAVGLETSLNVSLKALKGDFVLAVDALAVRPGRLLGIDRRVATGVSADFLLWDPSTEWAVDENTLQSKCRNTPFFGQTFKGRTTAVFRKGIELRNKA